MNHATYGVLSRPFENEYLEDDRSPASIERAKRAYKDFADGLLKALAENVPSVENYLVLVDTISAAVVRELDACLLPGAVARPFIPLITNEGVTLWSEDLNTYPQQFDAKLRPIFAMMALGSFCFETRLLWTKEPELREMYDATASVHLIVELESYSFWKTIESRENEGFDIFGTRKAVEEFTIEQTRRIDQSLIDQGSHALEMQNMLMEARDDVSKLRRDSETATASATARLENLREASVACEARLDTLMKSIDTAESQVSAFANSVREELKIDTTKKLWRDRAFWSAISFWVSAGVIAAAILAPPSWAIYHIETVFGFLKRVGDAATQGLPVDATTAQLTAATISRLVVITAPLALYFWAVKLLIRFNTRSMMLMDDARQRHTTLDTYFHLIERSGATTEERGLMLNALFRPLPGQGQDNIEPPNFMELVKKPD